VLVREATHSNQFILMSKYRQSHIGVLLAVNISLDRCSLINSVYSVSQVVYQARAKQMIPRS
jgi:hypothetical protein